MTTIIITNEITVTLTERTARLYEQAEQATASLRNWRNGDTLSLDDMREAEALAWERLE